MTRYPPPANLKPHPALANTPQIAAADISPQYNPNAKPILALRMPDGSNLIVAGRTRHQIALADPTCKAVKTTLIDYHTLPFVNRNSSIVISEDDWVHMTNAGEHIINRTATTEHFATYFTHNPITHAQAIEQGLVPIDPKTGAPSAAYTKGRQLAEQHLAAKAEADTAAAKAAAAEAKTQAEKTLPGKTKWSTPSKKSKPLSDSETKQTLISVAGKTVSTDGTRPVLSLVTIQRKKGTEYTVATDGRRLTVLSLHHRTRHRDRHRRSLQLQRRTSQNISSVLPQLAADYTPCQQTSGINHHRPLLLQLPRQRQRKRRLHQAHRLPILQQRTAHLLQHRQPPRRHQPRIPARHLQTDAATRQKTRLPPHPQSLLL